MATVLKMNPNRRDYWQTEIEKAKKRWRGFWDMGDLVIDTYRQQKSDNSEGPSKDKYNILYSSTETIRPNLYAQTPNVRIKIRNKDYAKDEVRTAAILLEGCLEYIVEEQDFDELMEDVVEDVLLPGMGTGWVRYSPLFEPGEKKEDPPVLIDEKVVMDYVYWQDYIVGTSRGWRTVPWVARRIWLSKTDALKRFGTEKANKLTYTGPEDSKREADNTYETAEIWEIWDKRTKNVYWYAESYPDDMLEVLPDPLKLKKFFPCPRPIRAIKNTRTFVPRALYTQYKSQAETLNVMTRRIRLLSEALRVVGVYDGSQTKLADLLNPASGNRMIAVDSWAMFAQQGGIRGNVEWLPITDVVNCLVQLQQSRETCKNEIYEITGFSDIVRGVSKASETLGAQNIKSDWAGARIKKMQKEVQRFARDLIALAGEIVAEHCDPVSIALFAGISMPTPEEIQQNPQVQQKVQQVMGAIKLLKSDVLRVAKIDIETDSTVMADEEKERNDRMTFLTASASFLQQAVPAIEATPELGPLLGAMLMFGVRTFPASRGIEEEFEKVQGALMNRPPKPDPNKSKNDAAMQVAQIKVQADQAKAAAAAQQAQADAAYKQQELQYKQQCDQQTAALDAIKERNRHEEQMTQLALNERAIAVQERELVIKEQELGMKADEARVQQIEDAGEKDFDQQTTLADMAHNQDMDIRDRDHSEEMDVRDQEHQQGLDIAQQGLAERVQDAAEVRDAAEQQEGEGEG